CQLYFRDSCPRHGLPHFIHDSPAEGEREQGRGRRRERAAVIGVVGGGGGGVSRAVLSLPTGLGLREREGGAEGSVGVFCCHPSLPPGVIFGPYQGEILLHRKDCTVFSWAIKENGTYFYVDASDENSSNWMR
ncbi:PRD11 protein, partial [Amia calva]|nr:PRD11 protein [Amia calva]